VTMSKLYLSFLIAVVTSIAGCSTQAPPKVEEGQQKISVIIENISPTSGVLRVALYNSKSHWLSDNGIVRARLVMVDESTERLEFWGLPSGDYGIAVYHDINSNNVMDKKYFVIPNEAYGFSNNARGSFGLGSPGFNKAKFAVPQIKPQRILLEQPPI